MAGQDYRDLHAWQRAMDLVEATYVASATFPRDEMYSLTQQLRRSIVSIPSNIAEGQGRRSAREFARFLSIAHGSLREAETQILIAQRLRYFDTAPAAQLAELCGGVGQLINGLLRSLRRRDQ